MKPKVLVVVSIGWVYRNLFCTGLVEKLMTHFDPVFCCVEERMATEINNCLPGAEAFWFPFEARPLTGLRHRQFRCEAAVYQSASRYHVLDIRAVVDRSLRYRFFNLFDVSIPRPKATLSDLRDAMQAHYLGMIKHPAAQQMRDLLDQFKPNFVWVGTTLRPLDNFVTAVATDAALPVVTTVYNWDAVITKIMPPVTSEAFLVWGDFMAEEIEEYYAIVGRRSKTYVVGSPQYDVFADCLNGDSDLRSRAAAYGLDPSKPIIFYGGTNLGNLRLENELVEELIGLSRDHVRPDLQWLVRVHPSDIKSDWGNVEKMAGIVVYRSNHKETTDKWLPDRNEITTLVEQIAMADVVVNTSSTITFDGCVLNKPVVCIRFKAGGKRRSASNLLFEFDHFKKAIASSAFQVCNDLDGTWRAIEQMLDSSETLADRRKAWVRSTLGELDGKICERIIHALLDVSNTLKRRSPGMLVDETLACDGRAAAVPSSDLLSGFR